MSRPVGVLATLRQPRYAALGALMLVVALVCIAAGVWQVYRYESKHRDNELLRRNAAVAVTTPGAVLPLVGRGPAPGRDGVEFRQLRVTGVYDGSHETLVRNRTIGDDTGFLVLTPLRNGDATLLVVRGFIVQPSSGAIPTAPAPPTRRVTVTVRAHTPETNSDQFAELDDRQVSAINPTEQADRIGGTFYDGYAELESGQAGSAGLDSLPRPDLSNPAGGAFEPQHLAYVIQWFLFAGLAVAAPFVMARAENKHRGHDDAQHDDAQHDDLPATPAEEPTPPTPEEARAAKLASRYERR